MPSVATTGPETCKASKEPSPQTKRESSANDKCLPADLNAPSTSDKQQRVPIVELKNGKVLFKQKPISFEKQSETLQEIVQFRAMLEDRINAKEPPLSIFPEEFQSLIAKLAHESDKTLNVLAKHIHHELLPTLDEDGDQNVASATSAALPISSVEGVIQDVLVRNNYGIGVPLGVKPSAAISVWRWEVRSQHVDWLPKNSREKAETRHAERVQAKEDLRALFNSYSQEERDNIIDPKGTHKLPPKELNKPIKAQTPEVKGEDDTGAAQSSKKQGKKKVEETENDNGVAKPPRAKKAVDPEKAAKEKERLEKKAAKAEREKKDKEAHSKSQSIMAKFFAKPKSPTKLANVQESAVAGPSRIQTDFEKVFKPFTLQKDRVMAPSNWFVAEKKRKQRSSSAATDKEVIVLDTDEEDVEMEDNQPTAEQLASAPASERLNDTLAKLPPAATSARFPNGRGQKPGHKIFYPVAVRDLVSQLSEAEISGNDDLVRSIMAKLNDRESLPVKAFCFHTDARPGYYGTWTRSSRIIGPRTPFAKDTLVFDYAYDSGEEWEEEPVGEDVVEDGEEEDGDGDEPDSDLDSWLVDDDEEPDMAMLARDSSPPPLFDHPTMAPPPKRKAEDGERKIGKKRKVVVPLVAFAKGPVYESTIGQCHYEPFKPYAIQLFNDTPTAIDPFTFVSSCLEDFKARPTNPNSLNPSSALHVNQPEFAVPALPPRLTPTTKGNSLPGASDLSSNASTTPQAPKKAPAVPKFTFPDIYMPLLIEKFAQLQSASISALVESIHLDLREHKVKKTAIEAKVREVGEKCKERKVWVIKPSLLNHQS